MSNMQIAQKKIVLIDDDPTVVSLMKRLFAKEGLNVYTLSSGEEFMAQLNDLNPDVVLLDLHMPGVSGMGVLKFIRDKYESIELPVIMLTAELDDKMIVEALELGANDYITKPMNPKVAIARIETQLKMCDYYKSSLREKELETLNSIIITYNHEINNPLSIAVGNLSSSVEQMNEKKLENIRTSLKRISSITKSIQELLESSSTSLVSYDGETSYYKIKS